MQRLSCVTTSYLLPLSPFFSAVTWMCSVHPFTPTLKILHCPCSLSGSLSSLHLSHWNRCSYLLSQSHAYWWGFESIAKRVGEVGMIWPAGVSLWAQRPLHRSIMHTLMAVKWLARNEKLPSSVRVMVSLGPLSPFKGNTLRSVGFLCVPAHVNYRQWQTISCFIRRSPWSYIILMRVVVQGEH